LVRGSIGGILMGLANLVPGISGGTMLLAVGVYPAFISALAELSTFRLRAPSVLLVGIIAIGAGLAILLLAGPIRTLVIEKRWVMYSLFIGLTLGGVPLILRLARRVSVALVVGAAGGLVLMLLMSFAGARSAAGAEASNALLGLSGLASASAMILPGVSGGYLLLLLGQYERILAAIDLVKQGLLGTDLSPVLEALHVVVPLGIGVIVGVAGVSNLLSWLLGRFDKPTLGVLLGLILGAAVGLWPFQRAVAPQPGDLLDGRELSASEIARLEPDRWPVQFFEPDGAQVAAALALIGLGFGATMLVDRVSRMLEARG
jgi:putative membrane protein